jgi:hypothetical protein
MDVQSGRGEIIDDGILRGKGWPSTMVEGVVKPSWVESRRSTIANLMERVP